MPTKPALPTKQDYYEASVQEPEAEIDFLLHAFKKLNLPAPRRIREDFAASAINCMEWIASGPERAAIGVDLDRKVLLTDGNRRAAVRLTPAQRTRLSLVHADVLDDALLKLPRVDAVLAYNFSYWCFTQRALMLRYFQQVRRALAPRGVFLLDFFGGSNVLVEMQERRRFRRLGGFTYVWDQSKYDPATGNYLTKIHFEFPGDRTPKGRAARKRKGLAPRKDIKNAFTYAWRLWTLPELRDILHDAGFKTVTLFADGEDRKGNSTGVWNPVTALDADLSFLCYIAAQSR
ncbi:hypothetical protein BH11PLA1_BH11PLA1_09670 [soil metagenome]